MTTSYHLGIDVGRSSVSAAVATFQQDDSIVVRPAQFGRHGDPAPAVAFLTAEGDVLFGAAAERRGLLEPRRLVREFMRSVGDDVPLLIAGHQLRPEDLLVGTIRSVVDVVTEQEGGPPASLAVTHPTGWGPHRLGTIRSALAHAGLGEVWLLPGAEAAVCHHAAAASLVEGRPVAVYDLGGTSFEATVLHIEADDALTIVGTSGEVDDVGGANFDDVVFRHALTSGTARPDLLGDGDHVVLTQLRQECVAAKEALSVDPDVAIPLPSPLGATTVRLTRSELEDLIEEQLDRTLDGLDAAVEDAGVAMEDIAAILLVGGASRTPRIAQRLSELFDRPIISDPDPQSTIALGAARVVAEIAAASGAAGGASGSAAGAMQDEDRPGERTASLALRDAPTADALAVPGAADDPRGELVLARPGMLDATAPAQPRRVVAKSWRAGVAAAAVVAAGAVGFSLSAGLPGGDHEKSGSSVVHAPGPPPAGDGPATLAWSGENQRKPAGAAGSDSSPASVRPPLANPSHGAASGTPWSRSANRGQTPAAASIWTTPAQADSASGASSARATTPQPGTAASPGGMPSSSSATDPRVSTATPSGSSGSSGSTSSQPPATGSSAAPSSGTQPGTSEPPSSPPDTNPPSDPAPGTSEPPSDPAPGTSEPPSDPAPGTSESPSDPITQPEPEPTSPPSSEQPQPTSEQPQPTSEPPGPEHTSPSAGQAGV